MRAVGTVWHMVSWPIFVWFRRELRGRAGLAATVVTLLILLVVVTPFIVVGATLAENSDRVTAFVRGLIENGPPDPPAWLNDLPVFGARVVTYWSSFAHDSAALFVELKKWVEPAKSFALRGGASVAEGLLQLTLSVLIGSRESSIDHPLPASTGRSRVAECISHNVLPLHT